MALSLRVMLMFNWLRCVDFLLLLSGMEWHPCFRVHATAKSLSLRCSRCASSSATIKFRKLARLDCDHLPHIVASQRLFRSLPMEQAEERGTASEPPLKSNPSTLPAREYGGKREGIEMVSGSNASECFHRVSDYWKDIYDACVAALRKASSVWQAHSCLQRALIRLESMGGTLSTQIKLIDLSDDPEIAPMRAFILGTLGDIAVTLSKLFIETEDMAS